MRLFRNPVWLLLISVIAGFHGHFSKCTADFIKSTSNVGIPHSHDVNTHKGTMGVTKV